MTIRILFFARARDLAEAEVIDLEAPTGFTVADLRRRLVENHPALAEILPRCMIAVNEEFAADKDPIPANAEVACIPPVSGG